MAPYQILVPILTGLALTCCSSSPDAPVNQTMPIRTMDNFLESLSPSPNPPRGYARQPGYAPAYARQPGYAPAYAREPGYAPAYPPFQP